MGMMLGCVFFEIHNTILPLGFSNRYEPFEEGEIIASANCDIS